MLKQIDLRGKGPNWRDLLPVSSEIDELPIDLVREIISQVRDSGDTALRDLTQKFDGVTLDELTVNEKHLEDAYNSISKEFKKALNASADAIVSYQKTQLPEHTVLEDNGLCIETFQKPVASAGCYVPGGLASYPSTVLMTALIAKVAGVERVVVTVPPFSEEGISIETLSAAFVAKVDAVHPIGGAQAIAALAYGTESVRPVDVIVGPGNVYVSLAKQEVAGQVGVPASFAGPSEIMVIADSSAPAKFVAVDLAVQAEHGPGGKSWLVTTDENFAIEVVNELENLVENSSRGENIKSTFETGGYCALVDDLDSAVAVVDAVAPEHLQIMTNDAAELAKKVSNAGAIFCGNWSPASLGDYLAGPSHVLPTAGTARFAGALTVNDFMRDIHIVTSTEKALNRLGPHIFNFARSEGLESHAESIRLRGVEIE
ncbi:MAG: histidinol dehydrogenase [Actinobacteria bacterium]|nr:histidinol dehydrogenase [Actinomycetota bacterium]